MKFSICDGIFKDWKIDDVFEFAARLGYDAVELAPFKLSKSVTDIPQSERNRIHSISEKTGVAVAGLYVLLASPEGLHINHYDSKVRERTKDYLIELVKFCADIGGSVLVFGSLKQRQILKPVSYVEAWEYAKKTFVESSQYAQERDVTICLEPLATDSFIATPAEGVKMIEEVNNPSFKLLLDTAHSAAGTIDTPRAIRKYGKYLAHVHVRDDNESWPGSGGIDWSPIAEALKEIDYQGYISTEIFSLEPDPETTARENINFLKPLFLEST